MVSILLYAGGVRVSLLCRDCVLAMTCGVVIVLSALRSCLFIQKWYNSAYNSAFNNLKHCACFLASIKKKINLFEILPLFCQHVCLLLHDFAGVPLWYNCMYVVDSWFNVHLLRSCWYHNNWSRFFTSRKLVQPQRFTCETIFKSRRCL